jgi:hypothetical protein
VEDSQFAELTRQIGRGASRRLLKGIGGGFAVLVAGGAASRAASARDLTICHATDADETPFEPMIVSQAEFNFHAPHGDFLRVECCADGECAAFEKACSSGACQNGYCVQLPEPEGVACSENACFSQGSCDGAMTCVDGDILVECERAIWWMAAIRSPVGRSLRTRAPPAPPMRHMRASVTRPKFAIRSRPALRR